MKVEFVDISKVVGIPPLRNLSAEEEAALIAEYKATRTTEELDADYRDFEKQFAEGVPAEQVLWELKVSSAQSDPTQA